jgi:hypothetical protein
MILLKWAAVVLGPLPLLIPECFQQQVLVPMLEVLSSHRF